jgi:hypothetical protein
LCLGIAVSVQFRNIEDLSWTQVEDRVKGSFLEDPRSEIKPLAEEGIWRLWEDCALSTLEFRLLAMPPALEASRPHLYGIKRASKAFAPTRGTPSDLKCESLTLPRAGKAFFSNGFDCEALAKAAGGLRACLAGRRLFVKLDWDTVVVGVDFASAAIKALPPRGGR